MWPRCRPPQLQRLVVGVYRRRGRRCGRLTAPNRGLTAPNRGLAAPDRGLAAPDRGLAAPDRGLAAPDRGLTAPNRGLTASKRGNCIMRGTRSSSPNVEGAAKRGELHH